MKKQIYVNNEYVEGIEEMPYTLDELNKIMDELFSSMTKTLQQIAEYDAELEKLDPEYEEYFEVEEAREVLLAERDRIQLRAAAIDAEIKRLRA